MTTKLSVDIIEFLERNSTQSFLIAARQFIALLEEKGMDKEVFFSKAHAMLLDLYLAGHNLNVINLKYSSVDSNFDDVEEFENKNSGLVAELGFEAYYWEVVDPTYSEKDGEANEGRNIIDKEPSLGWLVDDFADIYQELKAELSKIDYIKTDEAVEDGLWQLKWGFVHHWGKHSINALRYLHHLDYEGKKTL